MEKVRVTVTVCTLNEELKLPRLLQSVRWADEVLVLDCGSTDRTVAVAHEHGVRVECHAWSGFSASKNEAARRARNDWILSLDADEIVDARLASEISRVLRAGPAREQGFAVDRRGDFLGALLPNSSRPSKRQGFVRLYHREASAWDEAMAVHEVVRVPGDVLPLDGLLLHVNELSIDGYVKLFNRYATLEADELAAEGKKSSFVDLLVRPLCRFMWHLIICGEWRLGSKGVLHAGVKAMSDFIRYAKLYESAADTRWGVPLEAPKDARAGGDS